MLSNVLPFFPLSPLDELRIAFSAEAKSWKVIYGRNMNTKYFSMMEKIMEQIDGMNKKLQRPVKDVDDVRTAMASLKEIRENETTIDSSLGPIEVSDIATFTRTYHLNTDTPLQESYSMLNKFGIQVAREEVERVDTFRYSWQKLLTLGVRQIVRLSVPPFNQSTYSLGRVRSRPH